jgi:uncharacterized protein (DUF58 family)
VDTVPLIPRRRLLGVPSAVATSIRRGGRSDFATSRPYRPGDHFRAIDWKASARMSSARNDDEFIVRERHVDEMPAVVLVVDRRPSMALYPHDLPWLHKPEAVRIVTRTLVASAVNQRALVGYLDSETWRPPRAQASVWQTTLIDDLDGLLEHEFTAPEDAVEQAVDFLATRNESVPLGSFLFVLSDFTAVTPGDVWAHAVARGWDVVPVIVQDPVWEQSFPDVSGVLVSFADASGGEGRHVRLDQAEVELRRRENEQRLERLLDEFARLGIDAVLVGTAAAAEIQETLLEWAQARVERR